ncbi:MAG: diaminopimelate epimerase [Alphaproteobacteria bacterium]|nr:diaminopimelate epimerase [Alphaproteobacteria bacterium]
MTAQPHPHPQTDTALHSFVKMHGLGNDFIILDGRNAPFVPSHAEIVRLSDRRAGIGCDQLIVLASDPDHDAFMRIFNADGGEVEACGNATRCVGAYLAKDSGKARQVLRTVAGLLDTYTEGDETTVNMGPPRLTPTAIGLAKDVDPLYLPLGIPHLPAPAAISMGNPHMVFFMDSLEDLPLERLGKELTHHALYPQGTNVEFAQVLSRQKVRMRVWERGTGVTPACATGACATVVAGVLRGLLESGKECEVVMDGGILLVTYDGEKVLMRGKVKHVFQGTFHHDLFD